MSSVSYNCLKSTNLGLWRVEYVVGLYHDGMWLDRHIRLHHNGVLVMRTGTFASDRTAHKKFVETTSRIKQLIKDEEGGK